MNADVTRCGLVLVLGHFIIYAVCRLHKACETSSKLADRVFDDWTILLFFLAPAFHSSSAEVAALLKVGTTGY